MNLVFQWGVSATHGWGVYGLNLMRNWPGVAGGVALSVSAVDVQSLMTMDQADPLLPVVQDACAGSAELQASLKATPKADISIEVPVLHSLGNRCEPAPAIHNGQVWGRPTFGVAFLEDTAAPDAARNCEPYALVIAGSSWNEQILRGLGVPRVVTVLQGIDTALFHPGPKLGRFAGRFAVFSGGKLEHRKGQDLVIRAFRIFAERHPEAILVTAWHSHWPAMAAAMSECPGVAAVPFRPDGSADAGGWAVASGIPSAQVVDLGVVPNLRMGAILREMDVALFPNRAEGGTNLVAMECMASGLPVIVADNTGQKDLVTTGATLPLTRQRPVASSPGTGGADGWGESDIDEMVDKLEQVYADRAAAAALGQRAAAVMTGWSWRDRIADLHRTLAPYF